jgi:hypothetical protein
MIRWYDNDAQLLSVLCDLHLLGASTTAGVVSVPPRFIGILYDHTLSTDASHMAIVMGRLTEGLYAINRTDKGYARCQVSPVEHIRSSAGSIGAAACSLILPCLFFCLLSCQALFCMSHASGVGRLKTLLPRYARCVFEVTKGTTGMP